MVLAMRHGVLFYEATGLIPSDLTFRFGVLFYGSPSGLLDEILTG